MSWRRIGLVGLLPLLLAGSAGAQAPGRLNVVLEGDTGVRDDGNYGSQQDPGLQQSRTVGRAGLDLRLSYALERLSLALGYSPYYERTLDGSGLSGTTHRLDFGLIGDLNRQLRLNVRENLISTPNVDLYAPVTTPQTTVVTRQGNQLSHLLDVSLDQTFSRHASMLFGVTHSLRRYEDPNLIDSETLGARLGAAFELARGSRLEAALGADRYDYRQRGSSDVVTLGLAWATDLGRANHLRLEGGAYSERSDLRPANLPAVGLAVRQDDKGWRGGLQFARDERLFHWTLGASHDISPGAGLGYSVTADNGFLGLSTAVGRRLILGLDGNLSRQRNLPFQVASGESDRRTLTEFAAGTARADWTFMPGFRIEGGCSRIWQRAQVAPFANLSYARYYVNLAFRLYSSGENPLEPASLGRPTTDEKSDSQ
ncbi:MAG TPA: hypothetical protein VIJ02_11580 [Thermoanaerobaculia bacterium]